MNLQKAIIAFQSYGNPSREEGLLSGINPAAFLIVTVVYLVGLLSVPLLQPEKLIWFASYPILTAPLTGRSYSDIFKESLIVLPFITLIGIFNPLFDQEGAFSVGSVIVSQGWVTFVSILIRGLLSMQALLLLIKSCGYLNLCQSLQRIGFPKVLTGQLFFLYRYIGLLLEEVQTMRMAVASRGYGKRAYPIKLWVRFTGSLLLRTLDRSRRLHRAMESRCFSGNLPVSTSAIKLTAKDLLFCGTSIGVFIFLRFYDMTGLILR